MGKYKSKRGQITVFIILGIIILFGSAAYFYVKQKTTMFEPNTIETRKTTALSPYVEGCIKLKTKEALDIIGVTGGYIEYPFDIRNDPASYLKIAPIDEARMPYWWYAGENRIPPLEFIQAEVEKYLINRIDECINNFSAIKGYDVTKTGDIDAKVAFTLKGVDVEMRYPLRAVKVPEQNEFSLNDYDFFVRVPIRFKEIYDLSKSIMEDENQNYFMEKFTMDLISLNDNGNEKTSTPLMNMDFRLKPYVWLLPNVQKELQSLITQNVQYIKFGGTEFKPIPDTMPYMQNHYVWTFNSLSANANEPIYKGFRASATYNPMWKPFRIDVSPTKATMLKSGQTQIGSVLSFVGWQTWHFTYDLVYPVMITISDEGDKNSEPYVFSYAFLVSIQNNYPYRQNFGSEIFTTDDRPSDEEVCQYLTENFNTPITVSTYNNYTDKPLKGVNLSFTCGRYTCPIGKTTWTSNGATSSLTANFPHCPWGILRGYKEGYENAQLFMSADGEKRIDLYLKPVIEYLNYTVVKHMYVPKNKEINQIGLETPLFSDEEAVILISSEGMSEQYAVYPSDAVLPIKLYKDKDFTYNVKIYLFSAGETDEDGKLLGAYEADFTPQKTVVAENNFIKFHALEYNAPTDEELGLFLAGLKSYSARIPQPEFEKR